MMDLKYSDKGCLSKVRNSPGKIINLCLSGTFVTCIKDKKTPKNSVFYLDWSDICSAVARGKIENISFKKRPSAGDLAEKKFSFDAFIARAVNSKSVGNFAQKGLDFYFASSIPDKRLVGCKVSFLVSRFRLLSQICLENGLKFFGDSDNFEMMLSGRPIEDQILFYFLTKDLFCFRESIRFYVDEKITPFNVSEIMALCLKNNLNSFSISRCKN